MLNLNVSYQHLLSCAKKGQFTTYAELAKANGLTWKEARPYLMENLLEV